MKDSEGREFSRQGHGGGGKVREEGQREGKRPSSLQGRWPQEAAPSLAQSRLRDTGCCSPLEGQGLGPEPASSGKVTPDGRHQKTFREIN